MAALKRKKMHENHLNQTQAQIQTVEQQMHTVETANLNFETLKVMQSASNAMKSLHNGMNMDKLDETMYVSPMTSRKSDVGPGLGESRILVCRLGGGRLRF